MKTSPLAEILERVQYWSHRGAREDIDQRRERAIAQLEGIVAQMEDQARARAGLEATSDAASLDLLVEFVGSRAGDFEGELLQRFGYLAGLMESALSEVVVASPAGKRFLRKLVPRTALAVPGETETIEGKAVVQGKRVEI